MDVLNGLRSLIEKSLLLQRDGTDHEPRFGMLETVRDYGMERLRASGEMEEVQREHARVFQALAEQARARLANADGGAWLVWLEVEHGNLRAALDTSIAYGSTELSQRLALSLFPFWSTRGYLREGREYLESLLAQKRTAERTPARATLLGRAGRLALMQRDLTTAGSRYEESLAI